MTLSEARSLKWGTKLQPTKTQRDQSKQRWLRDAIFVGVTFDDRMAVIQDGRKTVSYWSPVMWKIKPQTV